MADRVRIHPALKHGAYAATSVLPGENPAEFDRLHRDLIAELVPAGALEDDAVATIAGLLWRKQNLATIRVAKLAWKRCSEIESNLNPTPTWSGQAAYRAAQAKAHLAAQDQARIELEDTYKLIEIGEAATFDGLTKSLDIEERLDTLIEKCLKRLLFVRGLKSISGASSSAPPKLVAKPSGAA
jgi:hypothetical protein